MSKRDDDLPEDFPPELARLVKKLRANSGLGVKVVDMRAGTGKTLEQKASEIEGDVSCLVINGSAEFESGSRPPSRAGNPYGHPVVPILVAKIPFNEGTKTMMIEFEEPSGLLKLFEALHVMIVGTAFADHKEIVAEVEAHKAKLAAERGDQVDNDLERSN